VSGIEQQVKNTEEVIRFGVMEAYMKDTGKMIKQMEEVGLFMQMEISMTAIGRMIRHMDMVNIRILMEPSMKDIGLTTNNMVKAWKNGLMVLNMKVLTNSVRKMDMESSFGLTCHPMKETF